MLKLNIFLRDQRERVGFKWFFFITIYKTGQQEKKCITHYNGIAEEQMVFEEFVSDEIFFFLNFPISKRKLGFMLVDSITQCVVNGLTPLIPSADLCSCYC